MAHAERPEPGVLNIEVVYCPEPGQTDVVQLALPTPATVATALSASALLTRHSLVLEGLLTGVWGRVQALDFSLRDGDRVEIYRPLLVDPKEARRLRYKRHRKTEAAR
jgi:uncharacterized protein